MVGTMGKRKEGVDVKYLSIKEEKQKAYSKDPTKKEGSIRPEGTVIFKEPKKKIVEQNPYEN